MSQLSKKRSETGGLHDILKIAVNVRVDVSDGLVNGAMGTIEHVITNDKNEVVTILIDFDNTKVGIKCIQTSPHKQTYPNAVPICKHEVQFLARGKKRC